MAKPENESVERLIASPPGPIFELLAHPRRHPEIDGSGTVKGDVVGPERLEKGSEFTMGMQMGARYKMINQIVEFEENRRIAWQARPDNKLMGFAVGGRIWRYELEETDGGTLVRETWDISSEKVPLMVAPLRGKTAKNMAKTLERIEEIVTASSD